MKGLSHMSNADLVFHIQDEQYGGARMMLFSWMAECRERSKKWWVVSFRQRGNREKDMEKEKVVRKRKKTPRC